MKLRDRYKPYIRRANGREKAESLRDAINLTYHRMLKKPFYVLVQRGWPNLVIGCGENKAEIKRRPLAANWYGFNNWTQILKHRAQGVMSEKQQDAFRERIRVASAGKRGNRRRRKKERQSRVVQEVAESSTGCLVAFEPEEKPQNEG